MESTIKISGLISSTESMISEIRVSDSINNSLGNTLHCEYNRHNKKEKRDKNEIGIHAIRGGTIPGEHTVIFAGLDEVIDIKHLALSKKVFAKGAVGILNAFVSPSDVVISIEPFSKSIFSFLYA
mgnify:CR=1 FL=1